MKTNTLTPMGSLHPILFFAVVYVIALVLSIFICSSIFYSLNGSSVSVNELEQIPAAYPEMEKPAAIVTVAMR